MNFLESSQWIEFFRWLVETNGGIATLTTAIITLVVGICAGIKQIRYVIIESITKIKEAIKGKKHE